MVVAFASLHLRSDEHLKWVEHKGNNVHDVSLTKTWFYKRFCSRLRIRHFASTCRAAHHCHCQHAEFVLGSCCRVEASRLPKVLCRRGPIVSVDSHFIAQRHQPRACTSNNTTHRHLCLHLFGEQHVCGLEIPVDERLAANVVVQILEAGYDARYDAKESPLPQW